MFTSSNRLMSVLFAALSVMSMSVAPAGGGKAKKAAPTEQESKIEGKPGKEAAAKDPVEEKEKANRSKFSDDQIVTLLVDHNPKRANSASHARFENYEDGMTVKAALEAGITTGDLNWDTEHEFIKIGATFDKAAVKKSKVVKEKPAPAEKTPADATEAKAAPAAKTAKAKTAKAKK